MAISVWNMSRCIPLKWALVFLPLFVLALCLLPWKFVCEAAPWGATLREAVAVFWDPGMQWMVFTCTCLYGMAFGVLRWRYSISSKSGGVTKRTFSRQALWALACHGRYLCLASSACWLVGLIGLAVVAYTRDYATAAQQTQALTLLGAFMLGQAAAVWTQWSGEKARGGSESSTRMVLLALVFLLGVAALWRLESPGLFQYRQQVRWTGPWGNPNTFGALMGVGVVVVSGLGMQESGGSGKHRTLHWTRRLTLVIYLCTASLLGFGLLKSYSRGAWAGTAVALVCLAWQMGKEKGVKVLNDVRAHFVNLKSKQVFWVLLLSVGVLAFWNLRQTEWLPARRALTVANPNDFSWRNRLAAWQGALQMMAEKPWCGFGWNKTEDYYNQCYRPARIPESAAIQLNDYFMLGTTLGLPALVCFALYLGRGLLPHVANEDTAISNGVERTDERCVKAICRAGALVLAIGFCFDGGLFKLAMAAPFWILLELGREHHIGKAQQYSGTAETSESNGCVAASPSLFAGVLRYLRSRKPSVSFSNLILGPVFHPLGRFAALLFLGALLWAKACDPFERLCFDVKRPGQGPAECLAVIPKTAPQPLPAVIYLHQAGGSLHAAGNGLRQLAELDLAAVGMQYNSTNQRACAAELSALLDVVANQPWVRSNQIICVGEKPFADEAGERNDAQRLNREPSIAFGSGSSQSFVGPISKD